MTEEEGVHFLEDGHHWEHGEPLPEHDEDDVDVGDAWKPPSRLRFSRQPIKVRRAAGRERVGLTSREKNITMVGSGRYNKSRGLFDSYFVMALRVGSRAFVPL